MMIERLVTVDPGLRSCGVAVFEDGVLVDGKLISHRNGDGPSQWLGMARAVSDYIGSCDELVIEYMQTRKGRTDAHDALIQLSQVSGAVYALVVAKSALHAPANTWTGRRSKERNHPRIRRRLTEDETEVLGYILEGTLKSGHKEILDAVGIGLWHLGRL